MQLDTPHVLLNLNQKIGRNKVGVCPLAYHHVGSIAPLGEDVLNVDEHGDHGVYATRLMLPTSFFAFQC